LYCVAHYCAELVDISDYLPETPDIIVRSGHEYAIVDFSVDTMLLDGHTIVCLHVDSRAFHAERQAFHANRLAFHAERQTFHADREAYHADRQKFRVDAREVSFDGREFRSNDQDSEIHIDDQVLPFNDQESSIDSQEYHFKGTGHYPILAGYDSDGEPLYVAAVRLDHLWHFTTVKDSASTAVYTDEVGETHTANDFFVLALRHDPSDLPPPYPRVRKRAMDPTGPVFWLRFWPEKDPEYYEDTRLTDDRLLESFLNEFAAQRNSERCIMSGFA